MGVGHWQTDKKMLVFLSLVSIAVAAPQFNNFPQSGDVANNEFIEDAFSLTPAERDAREVEISLPQAEDGLFFEDDALVENFRAERDGAHGHGGGNHRQGRRGGGLRPPQQRQQQRQPQRQQQQQTVAQTPRGGRQTGGIGVALGLLNNPPNENETTTSTFPPTTEPSERSREAAHLSRAATATPVPR